MASATGKEIVALEKFRRRVHDIPLDDFQLHDSYLIRWLRARDLDVAKADDMLRKHLAWRKANTIDRILSWEAPEFIRMHFPFKVSGFDDEGSPVFIAAVGRWDIPMLVQMKMKGEYQRYIDQIMELALFMMKNKSQKHKRVTQFIGIADLEGLTYRQFASKEIIEMSLEAVKRVEANHPEVLKGAYGINVPKIFTVFYAILKPFFSEYTQSKIQLFGSNSEEWRNFLRSKIPVDQLPSEYGGSNTTSKWYELKDGLEDVQQKYEAYPENEMQLKTIPAGQYFSLDYTITIPGTKISWAFKTHEFDVGFSVIHTPGQGEQKTMASIKRADAQICTQRGAIICSSMGRYTLTFDNTYSRVRSKELYYYIAVEQPTS